MYIYQSIKEVNEQFGRKINQDADGNKKLKVFRKEVSKVNGEQVESCSRIKDGNGWMALGEDEGRRIRKDFLRIYII